MVSRVIGTLIFYSFLVCPLVLLVRSSAAEMIQLERQGGTYMVPVRINDLFTLNFILDSGAADVAIPGDVVLTLMRTGTVKTSDFIGTGPYVLANGSELPGLRFILHELRVGDHVVRNVTAHAAPVESDHPLLGQSFLSKTQTWTIENARHALVLNDGPPDAIGAAQQRAAMPPPETMPPVLARAPLGELYARGWKAEADKNYGEAMRWYQAAAAQGNAPAQFKIGFLCEKGWGVPQNYGEAMRWYRIAADQGDARAQDPVRMVARGEGARKDRGIAKQWLERAGAAGSEDVRYNLRSGVDGACRW